MRNNDWGYGPVSSVSPFYWDWRPCSRRCPGDSKLPCHQLRNRAGIILRRRMISRRFRHPLKRRSLPNLRTD